MTSKRRIALAALVVAAALVVLALTRHSGSTSGSTDPEAGGPLTTITLAPALRPSSTVRTGATAAGNPTTHPTAPRTTVVAGSSTSTGGATTRATTPPVTSKGMKTVRTSELPPEARTTLRLIAEGGPFPYHQDGVVFENREHHLPTKASGYYHEYTVVTPGSPDRGARRIITGDNGDRFYTADHYTTFRLVVEQ